MENSASPQVSIIIPAYNAALYIRECIESVLGQTAAGIECIVVDDGSRDDTARIVKSFGAAVTYIYQENAERSSARNNGLRRARGGYVGFLDADDYLAPEKIAEQLRFLLEHPECDLVYSRVKFFEEGEPRSFREPKRITPSGDLLEPLLYGNFITMHSPLIRRSALARGGEFDEALSHNEDWEFLLRLALSGARFCFMDRCHAFCRLHGANTSRDTIRMYQSKLAVAESFVARQADKLRARKIDCSRVLAYHRADYGKALVMNGELQEGRRLIRAACEEPIPGRNLLRLFSFAAGLLGPGALRRLERATDGIRKWQK